MADQSTDVTAALHRALAAQQAYDAAQRVLDAEETALKLAAAALEAAMTQQGMRGVSSVLGEAEFVPKVVYNPTDWPSIYKHIQATGEFDLLHRRLSSKALGDRHSNGELPAGVSRNTIYNLKLTVR